MTSTKKKNGKKSVASTLVNRKPFGSTLEKRIYNGLDEWHKKTQIPKSKLLDKAVAKSLDEAGIKY